MRFLIYRRCCRANHSRQRSIPMVLAALPRGGTSREELSLPGRQFSQREYYWPATMLESCFQRRADRVAGSGREVQWLPIEVQSGHTEINSNFFCHSKFPL